MTSLLGLILISTLTADTAAAPQVALETDRGTIVVQLHPDKAPKSVENFLGYVESGFYEGTVFHRVMPGFMIQGGGYTPELQKKETKAPIPNEADNGLKNDRGTLAMARTGDPDSATAQFFINLVDNDYLNHTAKTRQGWGYTVFATVIEGMEVVDAIAGVKTGSARGLRNVPTEAVVIKKASVKPLAATN